MQNAEPNVGGFCIRHSAFSIRPGQYHARMHSRFLAAAALALALASPAAAAGTAHPFLLFDASELRAIRTRSTQPDLAEIRTRLLARADALLTAAPLQVSTTGRGQPDPPGELKGIESARRLQGRVLTWSMAYLLTGDARYRDAAVTNLDRALSAWPIWVDTAHQPPFDLMTGENCLTFAIAYDWLYDALTPDERARLREGVERRALRGYLDATTRKDPPFWFTARMNWNPVTNGGATLLALSLGSDSALSEPVLKLSVPSMSFYWNELPDDGAWAEGTGYWTYGHRYAFMAAEALKRAGRPEGTKYLARPGAARTGDFPMTFNLGRKLSASFGDSPSRANDALFYLLAREYHRPDLARFQDREAPAALTREGWPQEALALVWKAQAEPSQAPATPAAGALPGVKAFASIGWAMLAPSQPDPPFFLAFKNGSLAANHTHLDLNHVSVAVGETMILPDLGSRPYPADYFDATKRYEYYEITTAGHNSVLVGGRGQVPGRVGQLRGPFAGTGYVAFAGVADHAYQVDTPRARRHVVFIRSDYYLLLDEIETAVAAPVELRFHSFGTITEDAGGGWRISQDGASVALLPAVDADSGTPVLAASSETATGWTKPVGVLRLRSRADATSLVVATAIFPGAKLASPVRQRLRGNELVVEIGKDRLTWRRGADGWVLREMQNAE